MTLSILRFGLRCSEPLLGGSFAYPESLQLLQNPQIAFVAQLGDLAGFDHLAHGAVRLVIVGAGGKVAVGMMPGEFGEVVAQVMILDGGNAGLSDAGGIGYEAAVREPQPPHRGGGMPALLGLAAHIAGSQLQAGIYGVEQR